MYYNNSEILDAVEALTDGEIKKLHLIALKTLDPNSTFNEAQDAVQEALVRVINGGWTKLKKSKSFYSNMADVVYSMTASFKAKSKRDEKLVSECIVTQPMQTETLDLSRYDYSIDRRVELLLSFIRDDDECRLMIELKLKGSTKTQICEHMKLGSRQYLSLIHI